MIRDLSDAEARAALPQKWGTTAAGVLPRAAGGYEVQVRLEALANRTIDGELRIEAPQGWEVEPPAQRFELTRAGEERLLSVIVTPSADAVMGLHDIRAVASYGGQQSAGSFKRIHHPGLETAYASQPAVHRVRLMDVSVAPDARNARSASP